MNRTHSQRWLAAWGLFILVAAPVVAQDTPVFREPWVSSPSHVEVPLKNEGLTSFLQDVVREERNAVLREELKKQFFTLLLKDPKQLWKLLTQRPGDAARLDPELLKSLEAARSGGNSPPVIPEKTLKQLEAAIGKPSGQNLDLPSVLPGKGLDAKTLRQLQEQFIERFQNQRLPMGGLEPPAEFRWPAPGTGAAPTPFDPEDWFEQKLIDIAKRLNVDEAARGSPALQDVIKEVQRWKPTESWNRVPRSEAFKGATQKLMEYARQLNLGRYASELSHLVPRNLPPLPTERWHLPRVSLPSLGWSAPSLPRLGGSGRETTQRGGLTTLILAVSAAVLLWIYLARYRRNREMAGDLAVPGVWPVAPARVSNRDELIQAFEYLALLRLGRNARSQHHRLLAEGLGGDEASHLRAARRLADLYERARYAPDSEPFSTESLHEARHSLALLAGMAHA
jgi:hypothetical protein